jgi:hypothetical protein
MKVTRQSKPEETFELTLTSTPIKAQIVHLKIDPPSGPDPLPVEQYLGSHGTDYNAKGIRSSGWRSIPVLEFLNGRLLDEVVMAHVHALRPSMVRITEGTIKLDARIWRVTIYIKLVGRRRFVRHIEQEVSIGLPKGLGHGDALRVAVLTGRNSPQARWYSDPDIVSYLNSSEGYFKQTKNGTVRWNFRPLKKSKKIWTKIRK